MYSDDSNDKSPKPAIAVSNPYDAYKELMKSYVGLRGQSSERESCPCCKKLRVVDREKCPHCGADFAPPEKNGTEIFAPLAAD